MATPAASNDKNTLGLDIGGANLKAASSTGRALSVSFPLWKQPEKLQVELARLLSNFSDAEQLGITMTGELCDCFKNKSEGVRFIADAVKKSLPTKHPLFFYSQLGHFEEYEAVRANPLRFAATNWRATATYAGRFTAAGFSLFLDMGSTTTDLIPIYDDVPIPKGLDDLARLRSGELLYRGVGRTPISAILQQATLQNDSVYLASEWFATIGDVLTWMGILLEDEADTNTADNQPRTKLHSKARLSRMFCADADQISDDAISDFCKQVYRAQIATLAAAIQLVVRKTGKGTPGSIVLAGSGEVLLRQALAILDWSSVKITSLEQRGGMELSTAAAAYAVAVLLQEAAV